MSDDEEEDEEIVGIPCPVPNCRGFVKDVSEDPRYEELQCDYGHILTREQIEK
jgi:hypothetical protein